jgi:hypothetical protein
MANLLTTIADRVYPWQGNVGVYGGIPTRETIYTTLTAGFTAANLESAIKACPAGQVVYIEAGTHDLGGGVINVDNDSNWTLRGAGMGVTILEDVRFDFGQWWDTWSDYGGGSAISVSVADQGDTVVTLADASGYVVGDHVCIEQDNDSEVFGYGSGGSGSPTSNPTHSGRRRDNARNQHQQFYVAGVDGNDLTLRTPLAFDLEAGRNPRIVRHTDKGPSFSGIEDLTIDQNSTASSNPTVWWKSCYSCWLKNVELTRWHTFGFQLDFCVSFEVRGCYVHDPKVYDWGKGYAILLSPSCNCLVEDNIFYLYQSGMTFEGASVANVIAYNSFYGSYPEYNGIDVMLAPMFGNHTPYPCFNLFEGNYGSGFHNDNYYGPSGYATLLRNCYTGNDPYTETNRICVNFDAHQLHNNVLGNTLGQPTAPSSITLDLPDESHTYAESGALSWTEDAGTVDGFSYTQNTVFRLGYPFIGNNGYDAIGTNLDDLDETVRATTIIHGNWDADTETVQWDGTISDEVIPDSLYLSSKPDFFANLAWPPFGGSAGTTEEDLAAIPAGYRLLNDADPPSSYSPGEPVRGKRRSILAIF